MTGALPYYADEAVSLYLGDCREITAWLAADVLVTDPPYGAGWTQSAYHGGSAYKGIANDRDASVRDAALALFGLTRPAVVFGSPGGAAPAGRKQTLVWAKPPDSGMFGCFGGWRRDWEAVYLVGAWPQGGAARSSVIRSSAGGLSVYTRRGHPHGKPLDLMETLIASAPPGVVADPFAGGGSTLRAAKLQGRRAIGVEYVERYCEIAARALAQDALPFAMDGSP